MRPRSLRRRLRISSICKKIPAISPPTARIQGACINCGGPKVETLIAIAQCWAIGASAQPSSSATPAISPDSMRSASTIEASVHPKDAASVGVCRCWVVSINLPPRRRTNHVIARSTVQGGCRQAVERKSVQRQVKRPVRDDDLRRRKFFAARMPRPAVASPARPSTAMCRPPLGRLFSSPPHCPDYSDVRIIRSCARWRHPKIVLFRLNRPAGSVDPRLAEPVELRKTLGAGSAKVRGVFVRPASAGAAADGGRQPDPIRRCPIHYGSS